MPKKTYIKEGHVYKIKKSYSGFTKAGKPWQVGITQSTPSFAIFFDNVGANIKEGDEVRIDEIRHTILELKSFGGNSTNISITVNATVTKIENGIPKSDENYDFGNIDVSLDWSV